MLAETTSLVVAASLYQTEWPLPPYIGGSGSPACTVASTLEAVMCAGRPIGWAFSKLSLAGACGRATLSTRPPANVSKPVTRT